jgi:iron complex outermembrane recepter protein
MKKYSVSMLVFTSALAMATSAMAQATNPADDAPENDAEIVVTGTLLRGTAPVGSNAITLGAVKLQETGAQSANQLLASVPQVSNYFNNVAVRDVGIAVNQIQISRPNIRSISPSNASSSATLVLVDGHRIATAGVNQASVDPDLIPIGAIERVDVVTEGGSATYGSDAVAGTINFITRKRFDGIKVDGHYGFAKNYWQWDAGATVGKDWGTGSIYASYSYSKSDALFGSERSFIHVLDYSAQPYRGQDTQCNTPNLAVSVTGFGRTFATIPLTNNRCDNSQTSSYIPRAERHGALIGFTQDLSDNTSVDMRAYYGQRKTQSSSDLTGTVPVNGNNPYAAGQFPPGLALGPGFFTIPGFGTIPVTNVATVQFNLNPLLGPNSKHSDTSIKEYGYNAEIKHDLNDNWQLRGLVNWSESDSSYVLTGINGTRLNAAGIASTTSTAFNPFNVVNNNPALVADLIDEAIQGQARDSLMDVRVIMESKLFELPGGDVRLAVGGEHLHDSFQQRFLPEGRIGAIKSAPFSRYSRNVDSLFAELQAPVLARGDGDAMLTLSASGRYDKYSDFGSTFNPKFGAKFAPTDWLTLRGNWGTSFTAPTPLDQLGSFRNTISSFNFVAFQKPGETAPSGAFTLALQGSNPGLKPQTADTWSVGIDVKPLDGLRASASYYDVNFKNILGSPSVNAQIIANYPNQIQTSLTGFSAAQIRAFSGGTTGTEAVIANVAGNLVYELVDFRVSNFGTAHVKGIDASLNYTRDVGFGSVDFAANLNYTLSRKDQVSPTAPTVNVLDADTSRARLQTVLGANIGTFRAQATWNHSAGYPIAPTSGVPVQTHVGAFDTVNLFFKYDVPANSGIFKELTFTLNVDNVFNAKPPVLLRSNQNEFGFANGFTLGRLVNIGISKKF